MSYQKEKYPLHAISSSSSDSEEKPTSKRSPQVHCVDLSDDDDYLFMPLRERLLKAKNNEKILDEFYKSELKYKISTTSSSDDDCTIISKSSVEATSQKSHHASPQKILSSDSVSDSINYTHTYNDENVLQQKQNFYKVSSATSDDSNLLDLDDKSEPCTSVIPDSIDDNELPELETLIPKKKKKTKEEILAAKEKQLREREEKLRMREMKIAQKEREKKLKEINKQEKNSIKPDECIKNITVLLDLNLLQLPEASSVTKELENSMMRYELTEQFIPNCITWKRAIVHQTLEDDLQVSQEFVAQEENQILRIISTDEFLNAVNNFKMNRSEQRKSRDLHVILSEMKELYPQKRVTIITSGIDKHISAQKSVEQKRYREQILNDDQQLCKRKRPANKLGFYVSRIEVEEAIIDVQLHESCTVYTLTDAEEIARLIVSITKAIAESQFKLDKIDNEFTWFASADTRDSVKVDKDGNGLRLLWQRQLQQLSKVSADTAQAIISHYPTPVSLITAYKKCSNNQECQQLLENIMIRRGVGPLASTRRIGPELSRKLYVLMTSKNGDEILDAYQC